MSENNTQTYRVYSRIPRQGDGEDWLSIGLAVPHGDGKGFDILLQALPLDSKLILRRALETEQGHAPVEQGPHDEPAKPLSLKKQLDALERALIEQYLMEAGGKVAAVLQRLDLPRRTLNEKMARLGIDRRRFLTGASPRAPCDTGASGVAEPAASRPTATAIRPAVGDSHRQRISRPLMIGSFGYRSK